MLNKQDETVHFDFGSRLARALQGDIIDCWTVVWSLLNDSALRRLDYNIAENLVDSQTFDNFDEAAEHDNVKVIRACLYYLGKGSYKKDYTESRKILLSIESDSRSPQVWFMLSAMSLDDGLYPEAPDELRQSLTTYSQLGFGDSTPSWARYVKAMKQSNPPIEPSVFAELCSVLGRHDELIALYKSKTKLDDDYTGVAYQYFKIPSENPLELKGVIEGLSDESLVAYVAYILSDVQLSLVERRKALYDLLDVAIDQLNPRELILIGKYLVQSGCFLALNVNEPNKPLYALLKEDGYVGHKPVQIARCLQSRFGAEAARGLHNHIVLSQVESVLSRSKPGYDQGEFGWVCSILLPLDWSVMAMLQLVEFLDRHSDKHFKKELLSQLYSILLYEAGAPDSRDSDHKIAKRYSRLVSKSVLRQRDNSIPHPFKIVEILVAKIPLAERLRQREQLRYYAEYCSKCYDHSVGKTLSFEEYYYKQPIVAIFDKILASRTFPVVESRHNRQASNLSFLRFRLSGAIPENSEDSLNAIATVCHSISSEADSVQCIRQILCYLNDPRTALGPDTVSFQLMKALTAISDTEQVFDAWVSNKLSPKKLRDIFCRELKGYFIETTVLSSNECSY